MKKTLIALAIAGVSFNAAAVNLDNGTNVAKFASEIKVNGTDGTLLGTDTSKNALAVTTKLGFSITDANKRYVRFDVTGGAFAGVIAADFSMPDATFVVSQVGAKNEYVIVEVNASANIPATAILTFDADNKVQVKSKSGVAITYGLFETALDAVANTPNKTLASANGQLLSFAPAILAKVESKGSVDKVDVTTGSTKFVTPAKANVATTILGQVSVTADTNVRLATGATVATADQILAASKLIVTGSFSAGALDGDGKLVLGTVLLNLASATKVEAGKAELAVPAAGISATAPAGNISYVVGGKAAIAAPQPYTATFSPKVVNDTFELADIDLGEIGTLVKNGATQEANLVLAPDTSYKNLVRISNTSTAAGKFFVTVTADDGNSVSFPLSDVAGQPATLDAGASTKQMKVADIYAAAQARGLTLTGEKKMRLKVEGEVASLSLQNYTISKDGNALNTMNQF